MEHPFQKMKPLRTQVLKFRSLFERMTVITIYWGKVVSPVFMACETIIPHICITVRSMADFTIIVKRYVMQAISRFIMTVCTINIFIFHMGIVTTPTINIHLTALMVGLLHDRL